MKQDNEKNGDSFSTEYHSCKTEPLSKYET